MSRPIDYGVMPSFSVGPERERLEFESSVLKSFRFLVVDYGYTVAEAKSTFVRYEKDDLFVNVYQGRGSFEMGVEVGHWIEVRGQRVEQKFQIRDVVSVDHIPEEVGYRHYTATDAETVARFAEILARFTHDYAEPLLQGDRNAFIRVRDEVGRRARSLREEGEARALRKRAKEAFLRGDYSATEKAYLEIQNGLTSVQLKKSELKRLELARTHLSQTD